MITLNYKGRGQVGSTIAYCIDKEIKKPKYFIVGVHLVRKHPKNPQNQGLN